MVRPASTFRFNHWPATGGGIPGVGLKQGAGAAIDANNVAEYADEAAMLADVSGQRDYAWYEAPAGVINNFAWDRDTNTWKALEEPPTYDAGPWDASAGAFPSVDAGGNPVRPGGRFRVTADGVVNGVEFKVGDYLTGLVNGPSTITYLDNWQRTDNSTLPLAAPVDYLGGVNYGEKMAHTPREIAEMHDPVQRATNQPALIRRTNIYAGGVAQFPTPLIGQSTQFAIKADGADVNTPLGVVNAGEVQYFSSTNGAAYQATPPTAIVWEVPADNDTLEVGKYYTRLGTGVTPVPLTLPTPTKEGQHIAVQNISGVREAGEILLTGSVLNHSTGIIDSEWTVFAGETVWFVSRVNTPTPNLFWVPSRFERTLVVPDYTSGSAFGVNNYSYDIDAIGASSATHIIRMPQQVWGSNKFVFTADATGTVRFVQYGEANPAAPVSTASPFRNRGADSAFFDYTFPEARGGYLRIHGAGGQWHVVAHLDDQADTGLLRFDQNEEITEADTVRIFTTPGDWPADREEQYPPGDYQAVYTGALPYTPNGSINVTGGWDARLAEGWEIIGPNAAPGDHAIADRYFRDGETFRAFHSQVLGAGMFSYMNGTDQQQVLDISDFPAVEEIDTSGVIALLSPGNSITMEPYERIWVGAQGTASVRIYRERSAASSAFTGARYHADSDADINIAANVQSYIELDSLPGDSNGITRDGIIYRPDNADGTRTYFVTFTAGQWNTSVHEAWAYLYLEQRDESGALVRTLNSGQSRTVEVDGAGNRTGTHMSAQAVVTLPAGHGFTCRTTSNQNFQVVSRSVSIFELGSPSNATFVGVAPSGAGVFMVAANADNSGVQPTGNGLFQIESATVLYDEGGVSYANCWTLSPCLTNALWRRSSALTALVMPDSSTI